MRMTFRPCLFSQGRQIGQVLEQGDREPGRLQTAADPAAADAAADGRRRQEADPRTALLLAHQGRGRRR